jgi:mannobiose 2-epimerase
MRTKMLDSATHHLRLFLDDDWTPRSDTVSFGHDIEFSWLLTETAELLGDEALIAAVRKEAVDIARVTLEQGVDPDGGVLGEAGPDGITSGFKEWWVQAEAAVGFLNAFQLCGDRKFFDASLRSWNFIETHLVDRKNGEWFIGTSRDGKRISPTKVGFWKCPYHSSRACMELIDRLHDLEPEISK